MHADKHKVEDRLNTLEKSAYYETTVLEGQSPAGQEDTVDGLMIDDDIENGVRTVIHYGVYCINKHWFFYMYIARMSNYLFISLSLSLPPSLSLSLSSSCFMMMKMPLIEVPNLPCIVDLFFHVRY